MRTLAIGDIHGCHTALTKLLDHVKPTPDDRLIFLGDYIDRGPASRQVIETLLALNQSSAPVFLRGNHEVMLLESRDTFTKDTTWLSYGGVEMLSSYGAKDRDDWASLIPDTHWKFFKKTGRFHETDTDIFVHGCVDSELDMNEQFDGVLFWDPFSNIKPHRSGKRIVCGHTVQKSGKPANVGFAVCIDTGAAYGHWLTCLDSTSGKYWQANEEGEAREGML